MIYNTLGKTGIKVSALTIGAWQLGGPLAFDGQPDGHPDPGKDNVIRLIRELGDLGINAIDTAEQYSNGESERRVAEALAGQRDQWIISTKFGYRVGPNQTRIDDSSPGTILASLEGSLKRLKTDTIDIYLYHCAPHIDDLEAGRDILEQAKQAGKIRCYGISTGDLPLLEAMGEKDMVEVIQFPTNLLAPATDISTWAKTHHIGTQLRGIMANGRLSGKYFQTNASWRADDNRSQHFAQHDFARYACLADHLPPGYTMSQAIIRWALERPEHHTICMGAKSLADYGIAIEALNLPPLPEQNRHALEACALQLAD